MQRKGDYTTKEDLEAIKRVEQVVVLDSPWISLIFFFLEKEEGCRERRGKTVGHQLFITLDDLYNSATMKLAVQKECNL